jgi:methylglutaconyl-CoA hydratase
MTYRTLQIEHGGGSLATVWLNRPGHRNAIDSSMLDELLETMAGFGSAGQLRALVLAARGPVFCAGIESDGVPALAAGDAGRHPMDTRLDSLLQAIHACPVPVVAKVQGDCLGAGMVLVAACDIALAAGQAGFSLAEPGLAASVFIPWVARAMPVRAAQRYLLTAERFSAFEARQLGFLHEVTAADALDERTNAIVGALLQADAQALAESRRLLRHWEKIV